eukprot:314872-Amphidinium_carterae.1
MRFGRESIMSSQSMLLSKLWISEAIRVFQDNGHLVVVTDVDEVKLVGNPRLCKFVRCAINLAIGLTHRLLDTPSWGHAA